MLFDLGAMQTTLYQPKFTINKSNILSKRKIKGFDNKISIASFRYLIDSLNADNFKIKSKEISIINKEKNYVCIDDSLTSNIPLETDGILGNDVFSSANAYMINYENGYIEFLPKNFLIATYSGYQEVKSKFNLLDQIYIKVLMNGKYKKFLFDTGNTTGGLFLNENINQFDLTVKPNYEINTMLLGVGNVPFFKYNIVYENYPIIVGDTFKIKLNFACDTSAKQSNWGQKAAKKFNWIIDVKHKKVYCKRFIPIVKTVTNPSPFIQAATILNNKLMVYAVKKPNSKYNLGDEITAVNGIKVTNENKCDLLELLINSKDWNNLKLTTIPFKSK
jgi:hypothetical protein